MKRIFFIIATVALIFAGCNNQQSETQIRKKISHYKTRIAKYQAKVKELEKRLPENQEARKILVNVMKVEPKQFTHYLKVPANIEAINFAYVSPKANGEVKRILVKEGDYVKKGQVLLELDDELIKNNISRLETQLELADSLYQKQKKLYEQGIGSEVQYLQAKSQKESLEKNLEGLRTQLQYTKVTAPFDGIVDQINIKVGEIASPAMRPIYLINLDKMKATANLAEKYLPYVHKGLPITLTFDVYPDIKIKTKVSYVGNFIDPMTKTFRIEAQFNNPDRKIKPNMTAQVRFDQLKENNVIVIPTKILSQDTKGWYIYIVSQNGDKYYANKRYLTLGQMTATQAVVLSGLRAGELIITDGYNMVRDGTLVKIAKH